MQSLSLIVLCAVVAICTGDKLENTYLPPKSAQTAGGNGAFLKVPSFGNKEGSGFTGSGPSGFGNKGSPGKTQKYNQVENLGQSEFSGSESQAFNQLGHGSQSGFSGLGSTTGFGKLQGVGEKRINQQSSLSKNHEKVGQPQKLQVELVSDSPQKEHPKAEFDQDENIRNGNHQDGGSSSSVPSESIYKQGGHGENLGSYTQAGFKTPGQDISIISYNNMNNGDGSYSFNYETGNGIKAEENGHLQGDAIVAKGGFSFIAPDGVEYSVTYTADENGFHAQGAHLPTPPPIPEAILKSIEQNSKDAANPNRQNSADGDDGSYREEDHNSFGASRSAAYTSPGSEPFEGRYSSSEPSDSTGYHY